MTRPRLTHALVVLLVAVVQQAAPFETPRVGAAGGAPFLDRCGANEVIAGLSARLAGGDVAAIGIICRPVAPDGALGPSRPPRPLYGSASGAGSVAECPGGQVLRGLAVYFDDAVRGVGLYCRVWGGSAFGAAGVGSETVGFATAPMAPITCPPDGPQPAVGLGGATTNRVVSLRLVCDSPKR